MFRYTAYTYAAFCWCNNVVNREIKFLEGGRKGGKTMTADSNRSEPCEENCSLVNFDLALGREQGRYWQRSLDLERFPSASVATLITIAVALPVFKCADKKTHIGDSSPNTFVEATVFSERSNVPRFVISISPLGFDLFAAPFTNGFYAP